MTLAFLKKKYIITQLFYPSNMKQLEMVEYYIKSDAIYEMIDSFFSKIPICLILHLNLHCFRPILKIRTKLIFYYERTTRLITNILSE